MTSKISFLKLMREDAKRRNWMLVFLSVLFFVCYPVLMMIALDGTITINDRWRERVALELLAPGNVGIALVVTAAAVMIAAAEFSYLHSKEKMDLYYSIPVRRKKLFLSGYMTGFLMFAGIFLVCEILAMLVAAAKGVSLSLLFLPFLKGSVLHIIEFLLIYSAAAFAMLFTGNTLIAVFGMAVIAGYGPAVTMIAQAYIDTGFYTALKTIQLWEIAYTTPLGILLRMEQGIQHGTPWFGAACMTLGGIVVFFLADLWMCTHHRAECGGMALAFPKTEQILKILMVLPGALAIGIVAYSMTGSNQYSWLFAGFIFGVLVLGMLMEFVYHRDVKLAFAHKIGTGITLAAGILLICALVFDWSGYNRWMPAKEEIKAMSVCSRSGLSAEIYGNRYVTQNQMQYLDTFRGVENRLDLEQTEQFDVIYDLVKEAHAEGNRDRGENGNADEVLVKFIMQDGKTKYRLYFIQDDVWNTAEEKLWQQSWYQELCYPILSDDPQYSEEKLTTINISYIYDGDDFVLTGEDAKEVYRTYKKELAGKSKQELETMLEEYDDSAADTVAMDGSASEFYFTFEEKTGGKMISYQEYGYPLRKDFTRTWKKIREIQKKNAEPSE
jgi:ABC-2 type transport system permease protein